jgi:hypothetical protein
VLQVDGRQPFRGGFRTRIRAHAAFAAHRVARAPAEITARCADEPLRVLRRAARIVASHPLKHLQELVGVVPGIHNGHVGMAAVAGKQKLLLLVGAGHARQPLGVGELPGEIAGRTQSKVRVCGHAGAYSHRNRPRKLVADGADP